MDILLEFIQQYSLFCALIGFIFLVLLGILFCVVFMTPTPKTPPHPTFPKREEKKGGLQAVFLFGFFLLSGCTGTDSVFSDKPMPVSFDVALGCKVLAVMLLLLFSLAAWLAPQPKGQEDTRKDI